MPDSPGPDPATPNAGATTTPGTPGEDSGAGNAGQAGGAEGARPRKYPTTPIMFYGLVVLSLEGIALAVIAAGDMGATSRVVLLATTILVIVAVAGVVTYLVRNSPEPLVGRSPITISAKPLPPVGDSPDPPTASVAKGKVLCLATRQWKELEFEKDWAAVKAAFGGLATKDDKLTAASLGSWLISGEVVLIHYVGYVDQETGHLMFSEVDQKTGEPRTQEPELMTAEGFRHLVAQSKPHLIVFGTCHALLLAAVVSRTTNVITANGFVRGEEVARWSVMFYKLLSQGKHLTVAYETATAVTRAPMILLLRQDFRFQMDS